MNALDERSLNILYQKEGAAMLVKMIVTDLDNTLLRRDKTISAYTCDVFRRLHECGILIIVATARNLMSSKDYRAAISPDGCILIGGCLVYANRQLLKTHYLPEPQCSDLLAEFTAYPAIKRISARTIDTSYSNIPLEGRICTDFKTPLPERLLHCSCRTDDDALMQTIIPRYPELKFLRVSDEDLYDVNPKEATKLGGINVLCEHFGIKLSEIAAFGDDFNDIEMLRGCGISVAMSNAIKECKAVAQHICGDCDNDGVARWLEENVLL
ncbi:MAG: HAD family hydrolase [Oscillospiraceae bacterium]